MKWIGQHIYDLISRFRNDVYFEDLENGASDTDKFLIVGTSGKLKYRTGAQVLADIDGGSGDLTSIVAGTGLSGTGLTGPIPTLNVDASQTQITSVGTIGTGAWQGTAIATAYIADDAVTEDKLADTLLAEIDANTAKVTNSDQSKADINALDITELGTISSGVWQGTTVASAYLDADTAHLSSTQTFTGVKTFNESINKKALHFVYTSDKFANTTATETYFALADADRDQPTGAEDGVAVMMICPLNGILKHVIINTSSNLSTKTWAFRVYKVPSGADADSGGEILIATVASNAGPASHTNKVISFVSATADTNVITYETGYDAETMFTAGDRVLFSLQSNLDAAGAPKINTTLCFELDESTI
jgi:hypothetical protein